MFLCALYDHTHFSLSLGEQINKVFAKRMQAWAGKAAQTFGAVVRHCVDGDDEFLEVIGKMLVSRMFHGVPNQLFVMYSIYSVHNK